MKCVVKNNSSMDMGPLLPLLKSLLPYSRKKLGFNRPPSLFFASDTENASKPLGKTAFYDPAEVSITVFVDGRHPKDILRSISHELVHHKQHERGDFGTDMATGEGYAQKNDALRELEREAYESGNMCFRDWEDENKHALQEAKQYFDRKNKKMSGKDAKNINKMLEGIKIVQKDERNKLLEWEWHEYYPDWAPGGGEGGILGAPKPEPVARKAAAELPSKVLIGRDDLVDYLSTRGPEGVDAVINYYIKNKNTINTNSYKENLKMAIPIIGKTILDGRQSTDVEAKRVWNHVFDKLASSKNSFGREVAFNSIKIVPSNNFLRGTQASHTDSTSAQVKNLDYLGIDYDALNNDFLMRARWDDADGNRQYLFQNGDDLRYLEMLPDDILKINNTDRVKELEDNLENILKSGAEGSIATARDHMKKYNLDIWGNALPVSPEGDVHFYNTLGFKIPFAADNRWMGGPGEFSVGSSERLGGSNVAQAYSERWIETAKQILYTGDHGKKGIIDGEEVEFRDTKQREEYKEKALYLAAVKHLENYPRMHPVRPHGAKHISDKWRTRVAPAPGKYEADSDADSIEKWYALQSDGFKNVVTIDNVIESWNAIIVGRQAQELVNSTSYAQNIFKAGQNNRLYMPGATRNYNPYASGHKKDDREDIFWQLVSSSEHSEDLMPDDFTAGSNTWLADIKTDFISSVPAGDTGEELQKWLQRAAASKAAGQKTWRKGSVQNVLSSAFQNTCDAVSGGSACPHKEVPMSTIEESIVGANMNGRVLLTEGGAAGHMAHPFDLDYVKTGQDLLNFFTDKVPEYLKTNVPVIKTDGTNVSFKLISKTNFYGEEKREFAADRGSQKAIDIEGITGDNIEQRFKPGHGLIPGILDVLEILNAALDAGVIDEEIEAMGLVDNPDYFINTEHVKETEERPVVNVIPYDEDFIAFHGVNEFFMTPSAKGRSMSRKSKEVAPTKNSSAALTSFTNKVRRFARDYNVYGPEDTKATKRKGVSINFDSALGKKVPVFLSEGTETTDTLGGWLRNPNTKNPFGATIVLADGKKMGAMSKHVYFSLVIDKMPVSELLGGTEGDKQQMAIDAINGAIFYHATRNLGIAVLETLDAGFGGATLDKHEGIVMRDKDVFGVSFPIKITGDFIYTGTKGAISAAMSVKEPAQVEAGIKRKIAVFPGAFKPPHRGHMNVVEHFASVADQVVILISPLDRKTPAGKSIDKSVSEKIWQIYIDAKGIGNKVSIGSSPYNSPVQASFEVLKGNVPDFVPQAGDLIIPVASDKPDKKGNPDYTRFLKFHEGLPDMIEGVIPANIEEFFYKAPSEAPMSASAFRAALDTGEGIEAFLPTSVSAQEVFEALGVELEPETDEKEDSPMPFFMGEGDELEEMSSMAGGNVEGYSGGGKQKSLIREEEPEVVEEVLNYLLSKMEIL